MFYLMDLDICTEDFGISVNFVLYEKGFVGFVNLFLRETDRSSSLNPDQAEYGR